MKRKAGKIFGYKRMDVPEEMLMRYARGHATPEEQRQMEEMMADDPFLSDAVEGMMKSTDHERITKSLKDTHDQIRRQSESGIVKIRPVVRWMQAAAAIIIIATGIWFINDQMKKSTEKIFTEEFEPYPAPSVESQPSFSDSLIKKEKPVEPSGTSVVQQDREKPAPVMIMEEKISAKENTITEEAPPATSGNTTSEVEVMTAPEEDAAAADLYVTGPAGVVKEQVDAHSSKNEASKNRDTEPSKVNTTVKSNAQQAQSISGETALADEMNVESVQLKKALSLYESGKYDAANKEFEKALKANPVDEKAIFYAGVSYLAAGDGNASLAKLKALESNSSSEFYEASLWYQALAYVQKGEKKTAAAYLEKVIQLNGAYKQQAEDLLLQL